MKVSEAKTKVCPFIQDANAGEYVGIQTYERGGIIPANINCICGDCMAWEFTNTLTKESKELAHEYASISHDAFDNRTYEEKLEYIKRVSRKITELDESEKEGYCKRLEK